MIGKNDKSQRMQPVSESEALFRGLFENSRDAIQILDNNIFVECNQATVEILQAKNKEEVLSIHPSQLSPEFQPDGRASGEKADEMIQMALEKGGHHFEWMHRRVDGEDFLVEVMLTPVVVGGKTILYSSWRDIADRKRAEKTLLESEERFRLFTEVTAEGLVFHEAGVVVDVNNALVKMFGYKDVTELIGGNLIEFIAPESRGAVIQNMQSGTTVPYEAVALRKDGSTFHAEAAARTFEYKGQQVRVATIRDITEQKKLQAQVQEAFERRGYQVQISTEISQEISQAAELGDLFERVVTLTKERLGYYHTQLLRYDPAQDAVVLITGYGETGQKMFAEGHRMPMGSGLIGTAAASGETVMRPDLSEDPDWQPNPLLPETKGEVAVPIKLGDEVLGVLDVQSAQAGALTDDDRLLLEGLCGQIAIAMHSTELLQEVEASRERVEAQVEERTAELHESEERFRLFAEVTAEGLVFHENGVIFDVNQALLDIMGYSEPSELIGQNLLEFLTPESRPETIRRIQEGITDAFEVELIRKDGSIIPADTTAQIYEYQGKHVRVATVRDITARKQAEKTLRDSEVRFRSLFDDSADAIQILDDFTFVECNQATVEILHAKNKEEVLSTYPSELSPEFQPDGRPSGEKADEMIRIASEQGGHRFEWMHRRMDGEEFPVEVVLTPVTLEDKTLIYSSWRDIADRKLLEAQVQEAFERRGYQVQVSTEISQEISQAAELGDLFERVVTLTKERLGYYHTQLLRYDPSQDAVVLTAGYGEIGQKMFDEGHRMPMGSGLIGAAAATGETVMRPDLAQDPDWHPNPLLPDTKGEVAVPIKLGDDVMGVLDVQSAQAGALTDDDRLLLEGLCGQIAIAMEQTRLRQEMDERLQEINNLYRAMSHEGWQSYRETADMPSGFVYDQVAIRSVEETGLASGLFANAPMVLPGGETLGELGIADDPNAPLSDEDKAFLEQVSEQVALALESARLSEQTQSALARTDELYGISQAVNEATSDPEMLEVLARPAIEAGATNATLMYVDVDAKGNPEWTELIASWRLEGEDAIPMGTRFYLPEMPFSRLWMADPDNPQLISDVKTDERLDEATRVALEQTGTRATAIIPLTRGQDQVGLVSLSWDQPHKFSQHEKETYTAMIGLASPAVHGRRLFGQAQKQADRESLLNTISQKIQSATSVEAVLQIAARELGHALGAPMTIAQLSMKDQN